MNQHERDLLTAAITEGTKAPLEAIEHLGNHRTYILMTAAMYEAVERGFAPDTTPAQIQAYIEELYERFPKAKGELSAAVLEAVIRGVLGEEEAIKPLTFDDLLGSAYLLTFDLMSRENLDDAAREKFLQSVMETVNDI